MKEFPNRNPSLKNPDARLDLQNQPVTGHTNPRTSSKQASVDVESLSASGVGAEFTDTTSLGGCDVPPSYEEALRMPLAADIDKEMDDDGLDIAMGGRLELDYFTIDPGGDMESVQEKSVDKGVKESETCDDSTLA